MIFRLLGRNHTFTIILLFVRFIMVYVNDSYIGNNYKYLVDYNDNYIVLARDSYADGDYQFPDTIDVKIQYFSPSSQVISGTRTYYTRTNFTDISSDITHDFKYSRDYISVLSISLFILILLCFVFNGLTRVIKKRWCSFSLVLFSSLFNFFRRF